MTSMPCPSPGQSLPTRRNSDIDRFLSGLAITSWGIDNLVHLLKQGLSPTWWREPDVRLLEWLRSKSGEWHQQLYALLYRELEPKDELRRFGNACIVRISSGEYKKGNDCYFPTGEEQDDPIHPRVDKATYTSGNDGAEQDRAKKFLQAIGVDEVGAREQVEAILKKRYSKKVSVPSEDVHREDMQRFMAFARDYPEEISLFRGYQIFQAENGTLHKPSQIYLDFPYIDTGLRKFHTAVCEKFERLTSSQRADHRFQLLRSFWSEGFTSYAIPARSTQGRDRSF